MPQDDLINCKLIIWKVLKSQEFAHQHLWIVFRTCRCHLHITDDGVLRREQIKVLLLRYPTPTFPKTSTYNLYISIKVEIATSMPSINLLRFLVPIKKKTAPISFKPAPQKKVMEFSLPFFFLGPKKTNLSNTTTAAPCLVPFLHGNQCIWSNTEVMIHQTSIRLTRWWVEPTRSWKICASQIGSFPPKIRVKIIKSFETT